MSTNKKVYFFSALVNAIYSVSIYFIPCSSEGLVCGTETFGYLILGILGIPILFGIFGGLFSAEKTFKTVTKWAGVSLLATLTIFFIIIIIGIVKPIFE